VKALRPSTEGEMTAPVISSIFISHTSSTTDSRITFMDTVRVLIVQRRPHDYKQFFQKVFGAPETHPSRPARPLCDSNPAF
jgi:hypothetical protein